MRLHALRAAWAPLIIALAWLLAGAWARPLAVPDEGRYVGVAWGMLVSGDWVVPRLDGLPYFHKPPLFYWLTAASIAVFGPHEWAARAAPLAGAALATAAAWLFARRWLGERDARLALLALATQPLFYIGGQFANLDMLVAGCIGATILAFAHAALLQDDGHPARAALAAGYLCAALGLLAKGLIGFVLPALVLAAWLLLRRRPRAILRLLWAPGVALFLAVAAPWFLAMQDRYPEFFHYFFVVQHFGRYTGAGFNNPQPAWFFPAVLLVLALPWSGWLLAGLRGAPAASAVERSVRQLLWTWLVVIVAFFSLPASKLVGYILPATLPLALLAARACRDRRPRWWIASAAVGAAICVGAVAAFTARNPDSAREVARALRHQAEPEATIVFADGYPFDVPFYARLRGPAVVVDKWDPKEIAARDNWRRELADAGRFDPDAASRLLLTPERAGQLACGSGAVWVIGGATLPERWPLPQDAQRVAAQGGKALWRIPAPAAGVKRPGCGGTPSGSSGDTS